MADVLIYSKNPLDEVVIVEDADNNLKLIMKDGKVLQEHALVVANEPLYGKSDERVLHIQVLVTHPEDDPGD